MLSSKKSMTHKRQKPLLQRDRNHFCYDLGLRRPAGVGSQVVLAVLQFYEAKQFYVGLIPLGP